MISVTEHDPHFVHLVIAQFDNLKRIVFIDRDLLDFDESVLRNIGAHPQQPSVTFAFLHSNKGHQHDLMPWSCPPNGVIFDRITIQEMAAYKYAEPWIEGGVTVHSLRVEQDSDWEDWHRLQYRGIKSLSSIGRLDVYLRARKTGITFFLAI